MINKQKLLDQLVALLKSEQSELEDAAKSSRDLATQADLKSEGKYDTRAIEASYLAGAQQKRVEEIKLDIQMLEEMELSVSKKIQLGSLAQIEHRGAERFYFITSTSGGTMLSVDGATVLVISVFSPLGNAALSLEVGESFEVETPKELRQYNIKAIF